MKRLILFLCASALEAAAPITWLTPSLSRTGQTDAAVSAPSITLYAAKGETMSFQVIVQGPVGGLTNVNMSVSNLTGPGGAIIPSSFQIILYAEHYVTVTNQSFNPGGNNQPGPPGLYADGLIPFIDPVTHMPLSGFPLTAVPFNLAAGVNQPIWIDISVPSNAVPGAYTGTVTTTSTQGNITNSITLNVYHFALPVAPTLQSSFGIHNPDNSKVNEEVLIRDHRINPFIINNPSDSASLVAEGLNITGLPFFTTEVINPPTCTLSTPPSTAQIAASIATYTPGLLNYFYAADEIDPCVTNPPFVNALSQFAVNTHAANSQILITVTPNPLLYNDGTGRSIVDFWVMLPKMYVAAGSQIQTVVANGNHIWMYNANVQDNYSPKWEVDFVPINYRIVPGFQCQANGLTGILYSAVNEFTADPWNDINNPFGPPPAPQFNGEDILVYPGTQVGINQFASSMRLKWLRDGVNDYDYIQMLKNQGQGAFATALANTVASNWSTWSQDPLLLESVRQQLGAKLDQLAIGATGRMLSGSSRISGAGLVGTQ